MAPKEGKRKKTAQAEISGELTPSAARKGRKRGRAKTRKRAALIVAACVVGILGAGVLILSRYVRPPTVGVGQAEPGTGYNPILPEGMEPDEDKITILLAGADPEGWNSDTIMVATVDKKAKTVGIISIPRDTHIDFSDGKTQKINSAFGRGRNSTAESKEASMDAGFDRLRQEVGKLVGFVPKYYIGVDMNGFIELVDSIGGVEYDVPVRMIKGVQEGPGKKIDLQPGLQTLDGEHALMLVRYRGYSWQTAKDHLGNAEYHDDLGRIHTQQTFLKEVLKQCVRKVSLDRVNSWVANGKENVYTNMRNDKGEKDMGTLLWFAQAMYNWEKGNPDFINSDILPIEGGEKDYDVKADQALEKINKLINPYNMEIVRSMVQY